MGCSASKRMEEEEKLSLLSDSPFFLQLTSAQLRSLSQRFTLVHVEARQCIFSQGEVGNTLYLIGAGELDITCEEVVEDGAGSFGSTEPRFLCSKRKGDWFGESGILSDSCRRSATVTTTKPCILLELTREAWVKYLATLDAATRSALCSLVGTRMLDSLRAIDFLHGIDDARLALLANVFRYKTVEAGSAVFEEGDRGREFFIIAEGSVTVSAKSAGMSATSKRASITVPTTDGASSSAASSSSPSSAASAATHEELEFATLTAGQFFGEVALLSSLPRTATVRAVTRCLLLVLSKDAFTNFSQLVPGLAARFNRVASIRLADQVSKYDAPFLRSIPASRLGAFTDICEMRTVPRDTVVFTEGDIPQPHCAAFYIVVSGRLVATKVGQGIVGELATHSCFGEVALVTDSPRTATVIAETHCVLLSITKEGFRDFFSAGDAEEGQASYAEFSIKLSQAAVPLKPVLLHSLGHDLFARQLATEYSTENLAFWDAVQRFERMDASDPLLASRAAEIGAEFISESSPTQVNLPNDVRESCKAALALGGSAISPQMFRASKREIFKLMNADSFKRFKASALFAQLLEAVGSYTKTKGATRSPAAATRPIALPEPDPSAAAAPAIVPLQPQRPIDATTMAVQLPARQHSFRNMQTAEA